MVATIIVAIMILGVLGFSKLKEKPKEPATITQEVKKEETKEEIREEVQEVVNLPEVSDPNKMLSSGFTLRDAKLELDRIKELYKKDGLTEKQIFKSLEHDAKLLGTTLEEINRLPAQKPKEPTKQTPIENTSGIGNSGGTGVSQPSKPSQPSGGGGSNPLDKNGNGAEDAIEQGYVDGIGGSSTPYDGPGLGTVDEP